MNEEENKQVELIRPNQLLNSDGNLTKDKRKDMNPINKEEVYSICRKGTFFSLFLAVMNIIHLVWSIIEEIKLRHSSGYYFPPFPAVFLLFFGIPNLILSLGFAIRTLKTKDVKKKYKTLSIISIRLCVLFALLFFVLLL